MSRRPTIFKRKIQAILDEPYVHFFIIGMLLYILYQSFSLQEGETGRAPIVITTVDSHELNQSLSARWNRKVRSAELDLMLNKHDYDEVLLNESIVLGLEKKDQKIREQLIEKMRYILLAGVNIEPTEEELYRYYLMHKEYYLKATNLSFAFIFFRTMNEKDISQIAELLNFYDISPKDASAYGDRSMSTSQMKELDFIEVSKIFGKYFAHQIWKMPGDRWFGPIRSKEGNQIVYVTKKEGSELYLFDEVEGRVYQDYQVQKKDRHLKEAFKKLSSQYQILKP